MGEWWQGRMLGFDLETTAANPEEARIVQFAFAFVGGGKPTEATAGLVNPGIPIPPEATAINGITDEMVADAMSERDAVRITGKALRLAIKRGWPICTYNGRYDLTVEDRAARRAGLKSPVIDPALRSLDGRQLDLWLWKYRKGKKTLADVCEVYDASLDRAHDAAFDAIAAARLIYRIGQRGRVMLEWPYEEVRAQCEEWERIRGSVDLLHEAQVRWAYEDAVRFEAFLREKGDDGRDGNPPAVVDKQWPFIPFGEREAGATEYDDFRQERKRREAAEAAAAYAERVASGDADADPTPAQTEHGLAILAEKREDRAQDRDALRMAQEALFSTERTPMKDRPTHPG
jgi:DNA polymerase-3 subunit epsilon